MSIPCLIGMTVERYKIKDSSYPYFITSTIRDWHPLLADEPCVNIILDSLRFLQNENLKLYAYVIMNTHLHLVVQSDTLRNDLRRFRSYTATSLLNVLEERGESAILDRLRYHDEATRSKHRVWELDMHPEMIYYEKMMKQKVAYIHNNPVRAGLVEAPEEWPYSSAVNYTGESGRLSVITDGWNGH